ncbi:MAG: hypothetical protein SFV52_13985 [Saprospiraceae bacterium]|nr:hypothetical protein [Saprospiraceae bacterium]
MSSKIVLLALSLFLMGAACGKKQTQEIVTQTPQAAPLPPMPDLTKDLTEADIKAVMANADATIKDAEQIIADLKALPDAVKQAHKAEYDEMLGVSETIVHRLSYTRDDTKSLLGVQTGAPPADGGSIGGQNNKSAGDPNAAPAPQPNYDANQQASVKSIANRTLEYRQFCDMYRKKLSEW